MIVRSTDLRDPQEPNGLPLFGGHKSGENNIAAKG